MRLASLLSAIAALLMVSLSVCAETVTLTAVADNTLIEDPAGSVSNARTDLIFVGNTPRTGFTQRRGLLRFDLSTIPPSAQVTAANLSLTLIRVQSATSNVSMHKLTESWGEGTSLCIFPCGQGAAATANDATWLHRFYPGANPGLNWSTPGGVFAPAASATTVVAPATGATFSWSGPQLTADVQDWIGNPASNAGWIMLDDAPDHAKAFASREYATVSQRPQLTVTYTLGSTTGGDGDVPLPAWALIMLGAGLLGAMAKLRRQ